MTNLATINTDTHEITANYAINGVWGNVVETNGYTLQEVLDDMLEFWNEADETTEPFEVTGIDEDADRTEITIEGIQIGEYGDRVETNTITVEIIAEKN